MRYWKVIMWTTGGEYETLEKIIDEPSFRKYQKAIAEGSEFFVLEDRVIRRNQIKEIMPADDIVREHLKAGVSLKTLGLPEVSQIEDGVHINKGMERIGGGDNRFTK